MNRCLDDLCRHIRFGSTAALPLCLFLSACGGDGTSVASIPPPPVTPTPTPTPAPTATVKVETSWLPSPTTRAGTYDLIGQVNQSSSGVTSSHPISAGEFQLEVTQPLTGRGFQYWLDAPTGFLPVGLSKIILPDASISWDFNAGGPNYRYDNPYGDYPQYFGQNLKEYDVYSDGTAKLRENYDYNRVSFKNAIIDLSTGARISENLEFDAGLSYVAMGEWTWGTVTVNPDGTATPTGDRNSVYFVQGDRTSATGIPVSGTATYDARTLAQLLFTLTADFGLRSISTELKQASVFDVSGTAPFSNDGSFNIPLAGSAGSLTANGVMDGAFFGPHAEQVGGTFSLQNSAGAVLMQDAFVGQQHH